MVEKSVALLTIKEAFISAPAANKKKLQELLQNYSEMDIDALTDRQYNEILNAIRH